MDTDYSHPISWICYERSFSEFYLSTWTQLVFNQRLQLFVQSRQPYSLIFCLKKLNVFSQHIGKKQMNIWILQNKSTVMKCWSTFCVNYFLRFYLMMQHQPIVKRINGTHECPYPEPVVFQWQSSGNPVCLELRPQCTLECHWRNASMLPVVFQWSSSGFPVVFQCVPIMQINTGSPLGHHWVLASASVVPVASQCTCVSSGLPVCSNYAN